MALALSGAAITTAAQAELSTAEKNEIEAVIEDYIISHPELIRDVLTRLAQAEQQAQLEAGLSLVRQDSGDPAIGPAEAELTVYEFSDYNCGYCKRLFPDLQAILAEDSDLRLVIKEFPILAESSVDAARAGIAAQAQGKFAAFHTALMGWRGRVDDTAVRTAAEAAGLDMAAFSRDMAAPQTDMILNRTRQAATALELRGTPALVIGNTVIPGAVSRDDILDLIKQARTDKNS